jgi:hypothetical protein
MFARSMNNAGREDGGFDMYMTPAGEVSAIDVHPDLVRMAGMRPISELRFAVACAYAVPDAGPFGEIEVVIDESARLACGGHRLYNPERFVKAVWFPCEGDVDDAVGGVYARIKRHYGIREPA